MSNYPTSLHTQFTLVDNVDDVLATHPNTLSDELLAVQTKVGIDNSAGTSTLDYFLKHASGAFRTHVHDGSTDDGAASIGPLTGLTIANNVDVGDYQIRAKTFYSDVATGTAPFTVSSTTVVTNLNAEKVGGYTAAQLLSLIYPVGSIYTNATDSTNPGTLLGFGTWAAFGAGRVPVGYASGDSDFGSAEQTGGAKTHTLQITEIPSHTHSEEGSTLPGDNSGAGGSGSGWGHFDLSATTGATGGGGAHNNIQPYIVVYMWKRTA